MSYRDSGPAVRRRAGRHRRRVALESAIAGIIRHSIEEQCLGVKTGDDNAMASRHALGMTSWPYRRCRPPRPDLGWR